MLKQIAQIFVVLASVLLSAGCSTSETKLIVQKKVFQIERSWVRSTLANDFLGFRRMNRFSPLFDGSRVVAANAIDGISSFDRKSGRLIWHLPLRNGVEGGALLVKDKLYFGSSDGQFYSVEAATGKVVWTFPVRGETLAPPTFDSGVIYFQSGTDIVFALDSETGKQLWSYNRQSSVTLSIRSTTQPVVDGEMVYAGFSDGYLVALKKHDGALIWDRKLARNGRFKDVDSTPVIDGKNLYVASFDGSTFELDKTSGEIHWQTDEGAYTSPLLLGEKVFLATSAGKLICLDKGSGKMIWSVTLAHGIATRPSLYKGYLVYGESDGAMVVADQATGKLISRYEPGRGLVSTPLIDEKSDEAFFVSNNANLFAMHIGFVMPKDRLPWQ